MSLGYVPDFRFLLLSRIFTIKLGGEAENPQSQPDELLLLEFLSHPDNIFLEKVHPRAKLEALEGNIPYRPIIFYLSDSLTHPVQAIINIALGHSKVSPVSSLLLALTTFQET